jgi:hypothetical protein
MEICRYPRRIIGHETAFGTHPLQSQLCFEGPHFSSSASGLVASYQGREALLAEREGYCTVAILLRKMSGAGGRVETTFGLRRRTEDSPPYLP